MAFQYNIIKEFENERKKNRREGRREGKIEGRREGRREGKIEGKIEGKKMLTTLFQYLKKDDRIDELLASIDDIALQDQLLKEYRLS